MNVFANITTRKQLAHYIQQILGEYYVDSTSSY